MACCSGAGGVLRDLSELQHFVDCTAHHLCSGVHQHANGRTSDRHVDQPGWCAKPMDVTRIIASLPGRDATVLSETVHHVYVIFRRDHATGQHDGFRVQIRRLVPPAGRVVHNLPNVNRFRHAPCILPQWKFALEALLKCIQLAELRAAQLILNVVGPCCNPQEYAPCKVCASPALSAGGALWRDPQY